MTAGATGGAGSRAAAPLSATGLAVGYARSPAVIERLSVAFAAGTLSAIIGPNGSGKTTLLRSLAGLHRPVAGSVQLGGDPVYGADALPAAERARRMAVVLSEPIVPGYLRVAELVALGRIPHGDRPSVAELLPALRRFGIAHLAERRVATLSDGEARRALLARAVVQAPRVLVLDEPAAHLDPPGQTALFLDLRELLASGAVDAVVVALHEIHLALHFADAAVLLEAAVGGASAGHGLDLRSASRDEAVARIQRAYRPPDGLRLDAECGWFVPDAGRADNDRSLW